MRALRLFGIVLRGDLQLPGADAASPVDPASYVLERVRSLPADPAWPRTSGAGGWATRIEGRVLAAAPAGDQLAVAWGDDCHFLADRETRRLRFSAPDPGDPAWQRLLLDTVAYLVSLHHGHEALHAAAVAVDGRAVAIAAPSGMGKSTLVGALLDAGAELVSDDITVVTSSPDGPLAQPGPPVMNVPAAAPPRGRTLQAFGEERWSAVDVAAGPVPLHALITLDRRDSGPVRSERVAPSALAVLPHLLAFPRTEERARGRFELACALADRVALHRLQADPGATPGELAAEVRALARAGTLERT